MGRKQQDQSQEPPDHLEASHHIAKVETINGSSIYTVVIATNETTESIMVELPPKFRNSMWIRRGGFVLVDTAALSDRVNKLSGEIIAVIHDEKRWRKLSYWPTAFDRRNIETEAKEANDDDDEDEDEIVENSNRRRYDSDEQ